MTLPYCSEMMAAVATSPEEYGLNRNCALSCTITRVSSCVTVRHRAQRSWSESDTGSIAEPPLLGLAQTIAKAAPAVNSTYGFLQRFLTSHRRGRAMPTCHPSHASRHLHSRALHASYA